MPTRRRSLLPCALLGAALVLCGCGEEHIDTYRVPKEKDPEMPVAGSTPAADSAPAAVSTNSGGTSMTGSVPTVSGPGLGWQAPAGWQAGAANAMEKAAFTAAGDGGPIKVTITAFPSDVGGELANINRWRGQVGLPALTADNVDQTVDRFESHGLSVAMVDLGDKTSAARILGAIVPFGGGVWFVKATGTGPALEREKSRFLDLVRSLQPPTSP